MTGIAAMAWNLSAEREFRNEMPRVSCAQANRSAEDITIGGHGELRRSWRICADWALYRPIDSSHHDTGADRLLNMRKRRKQRRGSHECAENMKEVGREETWNDHVAAEELLSDPGRSNGLTNPVIYHHQTQTFMSNHAKTPGQREEWSS